MSIVQSLKPEPGLRVLITAGASGIGLRIAGAFIEAGARVFITDINDQAVESFRKSHPDHFAETGDAGNAGDVERLVKSAAETLGGLDVLVNNAGIAGPTDGVEKIDLPAWEDTLRINLTGQYLAAHHAVPLLKESRGVMINISSVAGRLGYGFRTPYAASKWGVVGFTKSLAIELGPDGVRVNAILPGVVEGERIDRVIAARAEALGISFEEMRDRYLEKVSLRRMVSPDDVAAACLFLSAPGGANISGQAISVCANVETL